MSVGFKVDNAFVNSFDSRAIIFEPIYRPEIDGKRQNKVIELENCNYNLLNVAKKINVENYEKHLCIRDPQNKIFYEFGNSMIFNFRKCSADSLKKGEECFGETELEEYLKRI